MPESVKSKRDGGITQVLLNRPEAFNALDLGKIWESKEKFVDSDFINEFTSRRCNT